MRQQEALNRLKEERVTFSRISALSGEYICFYAVDPETDHYYIYNCRQRVQGPCDLRGGR